MHPPCTPSRGLNEVVLPCLSGLMDAFRPASRTLWVMPFVHHDFLRMIVCRLILCKPFWGHSMICICRWSPLHGQPQPSVLAVSNQRKTSWARQHSCIRVPSQRLLQLLVASCPTSCHKTGRNQPCPWMLILPMLSAVMMLMARRNPPHSTTSPSRPHLSS